MTQTDSALLLQKGFMLGIIAEFWRKKSLKADAADLVFIFSSAFLSRTVSALKTLTNATGLIWERCWCYPLLHEEAVPETILSCRTG